MGNETSVEKSTQSIIKDQTNMEIEWNKSQKACWKEKIKSAIAKNVRKSQYKEILLRKCKEHGGPVTNLDELKKLAQSEMEEKKLKSCLRTEVGFQKALHQFDAQERSHLYKMNYLSIEELIENLTILLDTSNSADVGNEEIRFPSEDEIFDMISDRNANETSSVVEEESVELDSEMEFQQPLAVIWDSKNTRYWCIGFFLMDIEEGLIKVDHLKTKNQNDMKYWVRGSEDIQTVKLIQIIPVPVIGDWDNSKRQPVYELTNSDEISEAFNKFLK